MPKMRTTLMHRCVDTIRTSGLSKSPLLIQVASTSCKYSRSSLTEQFIHLLNRWAGIEDFEYNSPPFILASMEEISRAAANLWMSLMFLLQNICKISVSMVSTK
jgi:hypothetical protein